MLMKTAFFFLCLRSSEIYSVGHLQCKVYTYSYANWAWVVADVQYYRSPLNIFVFVSVGILGRLTMISNA